MEEIYNIELPDIITQTYAIFHLVGKWKNKNGISIWQYFCFIYFLFLVVSIFVGAFLAEDYDEIVFLSVTTSIGIVQICRMYCLMWKQKEINSFTPWTGVNSTSDYKVFFDATKKLQNVTIIAKLLFWVLIFTFAAIVFLPVGSSERRLIFNVAFPFDYEKSNAAFWIAHAFVSFGAFLSVITCLLVFIVWFLMMNLIIKYEILGSRFKNLGDVKQEESKLERKLTKVEQNELYLKQLIEAIKSHEEIYETVEQFASNFSSLFLLQIVSSSICICGSIYTLAFSKHEDLFADTFYCGVLFYSLVDCYMLMYLGNEIKLSSDRLSFCLYESNWIEQTESCKKLFIIVVERLKQPQELTVGKLFSLNIESFTVIVNRAYSMFNILQNLRK